MDKGEVKNSKIYTDKEEVQVGQGVEVGRGHEADPGVGGGIGVGEDDNLI